MDKVKHNVKSNIILLVLVVLILIFGIASDEFFTVNNMLLILAQSASLIMAAVGTGLIIVCWGTTLAGMAVTLAMMFIWKGIALGIAYGDLLPGWHSVFYEFGQTSLGPVSVLVIIAAAAAAGMHLVMEKTEFGRKARAVGVQGKPVKGQYRPTIRIRATIVVIAAVLYIIAALFTTSEAGNSDAVLEVGMEANIIMACIIGVIAPSNGVGKVIGSTAGCLILGVLNNGLQILEVDRWVGFMIKGIVLLAVIVFISFINKEEPAPSKQ